MNSKNNKTYESSEEEYSQTDTIPIYYESAYGIWDRLRKYPEEKKKMAEKLREIAKEEKVENGDELRRWADELEQVYLFSWDDVPESNMELIKFLKDDLKIEWVENAEIKKSDNNETITVTDKNNNANLITLKLNKKEKKVNLEIAGGKDYEYILKEENGKLNIYEEEIRCIRCKRKLVPYKTMENEDARPLGFVWIKRKAFIVRRKIKGRYLFSWNDIIMRNTAEFIKFLKDDLKMEWVENAGIKKSDNSDTITVTDKNNNADLITIKLNKAEKKINLEISGGTRYEYILKEENGKLNIYNKETKNEELYLLHYEPHCNSLVCLTGRLSTEAAEELFEIATSEIVSRAKYMYHQISHI